MYFNLVVWKIRHDTIVFLTYYRVNHLYFLWEMSQHLGSQEPIDKHSRILSFRVILFKRISLNNNQFSHSVVADSLQPHGLQHTRLPCPSPTPRTCSNSCPLSLWCHPTISSSVIPFSSPLQPFPASGSLPMSQFFTSGGQSIGVSGSATWEGCSVDLNYMIRSFNLAFEFIFLEKWLMSPLPCTPRVNTELEISVSYMGVVAEG